MDFTSQHQQNMKHKIHTHILNEAAVRAEEAFHFLHCFSTALSITLSMNE